MLFRSAAAAAYHQHVQIDIPLFRVCDLAQGQALRVCQQNVLGKVRVDEGGDVFWAAP